MALGEAASSGWCSVERLAHIRINHAAVIDWDDFNDLTNDLDRITIDIPVTSYHSNSVGWGCMSAARLTLQ
jgi:hypothetical protein